MRTINYKLPFRGRTAQIVVTSCWHVGNPACREKHISDLMARCADERLAWLHLGDLIEAIAPVDARYHQESHDATILEQLQRAADLARPARRFLVGGLIGNHEDKLARVTGDPTADWLARVYGKPPDSIDVQRRHLGGSAFVRLLCPGGVCTLFAAHSRLSIGGGTSDPDRDAVTRQIRLRRKLARFAADLKVVGHGHTALVAPPVKTEALHAGSPCKMSERPGVGEWCAMAPSLFVSYSDGYPSYSEIALYPPNDIGYLVATIDRAGAVVNVEAVKL